ncbi:hypothetical protein HDU76_004568 [Blyttiomyces sp. JEL0837]|nr:hypothetical protein HDU76_004568 [Blyttiomyces sp. JEL0837]
MINNTSSTTSMTSIIMIMMIMCCTILPGALVSAGEISASCKNDYTNFKNDFNTCVPGAVGGTGTGGNYTASQISCLCASNVGLDLTNAKTDCANSSEYEFVVEISDAFFKTCPNAKKSNNGQKLASTVGGMISVAVTTFGIIGLFL